MDKMLIKPNLKNAAFTVESLRRDDSGTGGTGTSDPKPPVSGGSGDTSN